MPQDSDQKPGRDFDLAPPPSFGVSTDTAGHALPVATGMEGILRGDDLIVSDPVEAVPRSAPAGASGGAPRVADVVPPGPGPIAPIVRPSRSAPSSGMSRSIALVAVLLALMAVGALFWSRTPQADNTRVAQATPASLEDEVAPPSPTPSRAVPTLTVDDRVTMANDVATMKATEFPQRHRLLRELEAAGAAARVDLDLHIALDLMQASDAERPCAVFDDALTLIEGAPDRESFRPAIASVDEAPSPAPSEGDAACRGLQARLDALRSEQAEQKTSEAENGVEAAPSRERSSRSRTKRRAKRPSPAPSTPPTVAEPPPKKSPPPSKPRRSVATKLDDDLQDIR